MKNVNLHKMIELILTTGMMAFIMSGAISAFKLGFTLEMLSSWLSTYPFSWLFAIPSILLTKKLVSMVMKPFSTQKLLAS
ncbi:MAG: DUF2798 domain-containing protein [Candidatus Berkiella sp.]